MMKNHLRRNFLKQSALSVKSKFLYINAPKCGCSTIKKTLLELESTENNISDCNKLSYSGNVHSANYPLHVSKSLIHDFFIEDYFVFTVVRNPYSRVLSAYLNKIKSRRDENVNQSFEIRYLKKTDELSFRDFLLLIKDKNHELLNPHWMPLFNCVGLGFLEFGFIGKLENMEAFHTNVVNRLSRSTNFIVDQKKHETDAQSKLEKYYDDETIELVNSIYHKDFEYFNYTKNDFNFLYGKDIDLKKINSLSNGFVKEYSRYYFSGNISQIACHLYELGLKYKQPCCLIESGKIFQEQGSSKLAINAYAKAIQFNPELIETRIQLSFLLAANNEIDKALENIYQALQLDENPGIYHHLGNILLLRGDLDGAIEAHQKSVELNPENQNFKNALHGAITKKNELAKKRNIFNLKILSFFRRYK